LARGPGHDRNATAILKFRNGVRLYRMRSRAIGALLQRLYGADSCEGTKREAGRWGADGVQDHDQSRLWRRNHCEWAFGP
jgi:hypothetical protein